YDTQLAIVEPVLRSVHDRAPDTVSAHAGFYGAGMCTLFFMLTSLVSPCVLGVLGSKYTLLLGSVLFTVHLASFQYIHYLPYYITATGIGIGYALFCSGYGGYITEHSTKKTIERNSALTWALATSCMIAGGGVLALTAQKPSQAIVANSTTLIDDRLLNGNMHGAKTRSFRTYSDAEIKMVYGAFAGICILGNLVYLLIPSKPVANSIARSSGRKGVGFVDQMRKIYDTFTDARANLLTPLFLNIGLSTCFWVTVYPTTLIFSRALSGHIYLPALYMATLGLGEILMGLLIAVAAKHIKNFAQLPSLIIGSILFLIALVLALLSTPPAATNSPTIGTTPLLQPSPSIALVIALLLGMSDNSFNTSRTVLCALVIPENIAESLAESIIFFIAPLMSMSVHFGVMAVFCLLSLIFYWRAAKSTRRAEKE
ncbi:hypothetical protein PMAYCL1PPCAC_21993, partial [Pristionchus mayeri]